jgi:hypothetical protein
VCHGFENVVVVTFLFPEVINETCIHEDPFFKKKLKLANMSIVKIYENVFIGQTL